MKPSRLKMLWYIFQRFYWSYLHYLVEIWTFLGKKLNPCWDPYIHAYFLYYEIWRNFKEKLKNLKNFVIFWFWVLYESRNGSGTLRGCFQQLIRPWNHIFSFLKQNCTFFQKSLPSSLKPTVVPYFLEGIHVFVDIFRLILTFSRRYNNFFRNENHKIM